MNASCLDEKGRFKSCPYRVYTDEHKAVLRGQVSSSMARTTVTILPDNERVIDYDCEEGYAWK